MLKDSDAGLGRRIPQDVGGGRADSNTGARFDKENMTIKWTEEDGKSSVTSYGFNKSRFEIHC